MQEARLARVCFHLAAKAGDLDVDGALAGLVHAEGGGDVLARQDLVGLAGQGDEQGGLAAGEADDTIGAGEFAALGIEEQRAKLDRAGAGLRDGRGGTAEQGADAQDEFAGFEWLAEVVVGAGFEAGDAVFRRAAGGEQEDRDVRCPAGAGTRSASGRFRRASSRRAPACRGA